MSLAAATRTATPREVQKPHDMSCDTPLPHITEVSTHKILFAKETKAENLLKWMIQKHE
jgi:hypothetical protein